MEVEKKNFFEKYGLLSAVLSYLAFFIILSSFILLGLFLFYSFTYSLDFKKLMSMASLSLVTEEDLKIFYGYGDNYVNAFALSNAWGNFLAYLFSFITVTISMIFYLKKDFLDLKNNYKKLIIYTIIATVLFMGVSFLVEFLVGLAVNDSQNQNLIVIIMQNGGTIPMAICTVLFAPIVEELIYRKVIFEYGKKIHIAFSYAASIVLFALPHMISTNNTNIGIWLLQAIPYITSAGLFAVIYHKSNYNIYVTIFIHMVNNLIAVLLVLI